MKLSAYQIVFAFRIPLAGLVIQAGRVVPFGRAYGPARCLECVTSGSWSFTLSRGAYAVFVSRPQSSARKNAVQAIVPARQIVPCSVSKSPVLQVSNEGNRALKYGKPGSLA